MYCCEAIDHVTRAVNNIGVIIGKIDDYFVVFDEGCCQKFCYNWLLKTLNHAIWKMEMSPSLCCSKDMRDVA